MYKQEIAIAESKSGDKLPHGGQFIAIFVRSFLVLVVQTAINSSLLYELEPRVEYD